VGSFEPVRRRGAPVRVELDTDEVATLGQGCDAGPARAGERVEHDTASWCDLNELTHQLDRHLGYLDPLAGRVDKEMIARCFGDDVQRPWAVRAPDDELVVVGVAALDAPAVGFAPDSDAPPHEPGRLQRVAHRRQLPPVAKTAAMPPEALRVV
jgi:hypothetical protein